MLLRGGVHGNHNHVTDVLRSSCGSEIMCRPQLVECGTEEEPHPFLLIEDGRHPCIVNSSSGTEFIPNSVCIHHPSNCLLVTGPNMGGKSTLLRQCGLLVVLAQMVSCYIVAI